jgi:acetyl esterase/lipase
LYLHGRGRSRPRSHHGLGFDWASPIYADLKGLPPVYVQVGGDETLLDDSRRLGERAREAGVDVTVDVYPACSMFSGVVTLLNEERKKAAGRKIVRRPPHAKYLSPRRGSLGASTLKSDDVGR